MTKQGLYQKYIKRLCDIVIAIFALLLLSPIYIVVGFLVRIKMGSPVIFKQERPGLNDKVFVMYKFRSMREGRDEKGEVLSDSERLTQFGKFIRATSIDELPEFINILKGDMSLVGPRPLLVDYLPLYNETQRTRNKVRPGLTGLAQVSGRNTITWEEKLSLDVEYVENISFKMDLSILLKTVGQVIKREGISAEGEATVQPFRGDIDA